MKSVSGVDLKAAPAMGAIGALGSIHESGSFAARRIFTRGGGFDDKRLEVTIREELKLNWAGTSVCSLKHKHSKKP